MNTQVFQYKVPRQCLVDNFQHEWSADCGTDEEYRMHTTEFWEEYSHTWVLLEILNTKRALASMRLSSANLQVNIGRFTNASCSNRNHSVCNQNVAKDKFHFIFLCPVYKNMALFCYVADNCASYLGEKLA